MDFAITALLFAAAWPQFGRDPAHSGASSVNGQPLQRVLAQVQMDPFTDIERSAQGGATLLIHYAVPVLDGDDVFLEIKGGTYTAADWSTQTWSVRALRWEGNRLVPRWTATSDWKPVPFTEGAGPLFEAVFQPVLANNSIYMPGAGGTVLRIDRDTGATTARIGAPENATFVAGPLPPMRTATSCSTSSSSHHPTPGSPTCAMRG